MKNGKEPKVVVIGLDCAEPQLLFERYRGRLPNLERLMARGTYGRLRSCDPPITVPAWSSMMSSKDPGTLGIYGFGASAHLTAQVARAQGIEVRVMTRDERARELALELGAASAGSALGPPPVPLDSAIVFAPAGEIVPHALAALGPGGTLALAGIHMSDIPQLTYERHLFREKTLTSVTSNTRTLEPATSVLASTGAVKPADHGAVVLKPSSAFIATLGSLKSFASSTGMLSVRSVVPLNSRLFGNGMTPLAGSKFATVWNWTGAV